MPVHLHPAIERAVEDPTEGDKMRVLLVFEEGTETPSSEHFEQYDTTIERDLGNGVLLVEAPESELEQLGELSGVASISPDEEMRILT
jgi:hypothetical protein